MQILKRQRFQFQASMQINSLVPIELNNQIGYGLTILTVL